MTTIVLESEQQRVEFCKELAKAELPVTISVAKGRQRSLAQNRLLQKWYKEIAAQMYEPPDYVRAYCKLHFGIPILREENNNFKIKYDAILKSKTYEDKMAMMMWPFELPVTSLMTVPQLTEYLERIHKFFTEKGFEMTAPDSEMRDDPAIA